MDVASLQRKGEAQVTIRPTGLGFHFTTNRVGRLTHWPRAQSLTKLKDAIRAKTKRTVGRNLGTIIAEVNPTLRGWYAYFQHSYRLTFSTLDGWIRKRLRSIERWRQGRSGHSRDTDHQRWPNAFFATQGLFSLSTAPAVACQSPGG